MAGSEIDDGEPDDQNDEGEADRHFGRRKYGLDREP
jgi:hypothetical protein